MENAKMPAVPDLADDPARYGFSPPALPYRSPRLRLGLAQLRNINMKHLQLNLSPAPTHSESPHSHAPADELGVEELQERSNTNVYPFGPAHVTGAVHLYLDPLETNVDINEYALVVNVAKECPDLSARYTRPDGKYLFLPWGHTLEILADLPLLTREMARYDRPGNKILVHCHCGVLRLACVVIAYFMTRFSLSVNEAYELLRLGSTNNERVDRDLAAGGHVVRPCDRICPNMTLIFELMEFADSR